MEQLVRTLELSGGIGRDGSILGEGAGPLHGDVCVLEVLTVGRHVAPLAGRGRSRAKPVNHRTVHYGPEKREVGRSASRISRVRALAPGNT